MFETRTADPTERLISAAEAKQWARIDTATEDALIDSLILSVEAEVENMTGRPLLTQTWRLETRAPRHRDFLALPKAPVQSISSITYYDPADVQQSLTVGDFDVIGDPDRAYLRPRDGVSWPSTYNRPDALSVTYVAGYGSAAADVPAGIRTAAEVLFHHFYDALRAGEEKAVPQGVSLLLQRYRVGWVG